MENKEFDAFIKRIVDQEDIPYDKSSWNRLNELLPFKEEPKIIPFLRDSKKTMLGKKAIGIAAAITLLIGASIVFTHYSSNDSQIQNPILTEESISLKDKNSQNIQDDLMISSENPNTNPYHLNSAKKSTIAKALKNQNKYIDPLSNPKNKFFPNANEPSNSLKQNPIAKIDAQKNNKNINEEANLQNHQNEEFAPKIISQKQSPVVAKNEINSGHITTASNYFDELDFPTNSTKATSMLSFGGGVNYSSLNTGYALSLGAKQRINKNLYFDGNVSILYNNNINNGGNFAGKGLNLKSKISPNSPGFSSWKNVLYVQLNPSIGYQVIENLGLSIGPDIQQMLSNDNNFEKIQFTDNGIKVFPIIDVGFTTKAEFDVGENLQTGIIYRQGVNNMFKSEDALPFINRRYIQVQFKYNLPIKRKN